MINQLLRERHSCYFVLKTKFSYRNYSWNLTLIYQNIGADEIISCGKIGKMKLLFLYASIFKRAKSTVASKYRW